MLNVTKQILLELQPAHHRRFGINQNASQVDNFENAEDLFGKDMAEENEMQEAEAPTDFLHLLSILWKTDELKLFALANPDGYFYLRYLMTCLQMFLATSLIGAAPLAYKCYVENMLSA